MDFMEDFSVASVSLEYYFFSSVMTDSWRGIVDKGAWKEEKKMTQHQSSKFHLPFYFRFGSSNLFSPAKPEFWPAFWPLAAHLFKP